MKRNKPNLRKMFNFHTIILLIFVIVVSTLQTHTSVGKLQRLHKHHHNHNYKQHNVVVDGNVYEDDDNEAGVEHQRQHGQRNHPHTHTHTHHNRQHLHSEQQLQLQHYVATAPSLEFTTSSLFNFPQISSDNEFLIKQQELPPLSHKDEIYYKTKDLEPLASTSTTSKPSSLSIHLMKQSKNVHILRMSSKSNTTSANAKTLANSKREHTHHSHNRRLISTPLTNPEVNNSGIDNHHTDNVATMFAQGLENKNFNWNLASRDDDANASKQSEQHHQQNHSHNVQKPVFGNEQHQRRQQQQQQHNYDDYYSDAEDDETDDDVDNDDDDDYSEDEGDNDGISYEDEKNLSDRSYARITRSKLDDDYIDDEPYRNGINELSMQRDAAPGVLTEQKYLDVGSEKAVQQARERYIQEQKRPRTPHELATEHWHRMIQATKCRKPLPRVIPVSNNTSKRYEPYATILHRCGDDTGCCGSTASVCTVKRHEIVMVYVFSYDFNYRKEIEALPMQNHTECHCVNRGSLLHDSMPRDKRSGGSGTYLHHLQRLQRRQQQQQQQKEQQHQSSESQSHTQLQSHHQTQQQNMLDCHCPRHFNVFEEDVERHVHLPKPHSVFIRKCRCDCLVNSQTCLRFKHGEEGFSLEDRKCIMERSCKPPVCLYGDYNLRVGRCPSYRSHLLQTT